jgi:hypothetical protein
MLHPSDSQLPDAYWWTGTPDTMSLYLRYGCVAVVRGGRIEVRADPPWPALAGACPSVATGMAYVERIIAIRGGYGAPAQRLRRLAMRRRRALAAGAPAALPDPDGEDALRLP